MQLKLVNVATDPNFDKFEGSRYLGESSRPPPRINVTWFSWVTALSEIGTGLLFAYAGARAKRSSEDSS